MTKYFKFTNEKENHHGFQYKDGLNVDILPFSENGSCCKGGLYFTTTEYLMKFLGPGMKWVREVSIPEGETKWVKDPDNNKWRSHSLYCQPSKSLKDPATWQWLIDNGINIDDALKYSACHGYLEVVKYLTEHFNKFSQNAIDDALKYSACHGYLEVVKYLTEHFNKFSQNAIDDALENSAMYGHLEVNSYLKQHFNK